MELTHLNEAGDARMVDVSSKPDTDRVAVAEAIVEMSTEIRDRFTGGDLPKGDAAAVARIAAIQASKRTAELIPLCHPLSIDAVDVEIASVDVGVRIEVSVKTTGPTGVEMEALTAAAIGALTVYDMVKGLERGARISAVQLLEKSGGKSGEWRRP
jgi:cyclic pyranopterin phosphate synthase